MKTTIDALVEAALKRAFGLGQTYWQQADSDFTSHHKKAEATRQNFLAVCEETLAALAQARAEQAEPVAGYGSLWPNGNPSRGDLSPEEDCPAAAPVAKLGGAA